VLNQQYPNVRSVKEATGDLANMELTRKLCGEDFDILSGDDDKTFVMMTSPDITASGVISVASNIAPRAISNMVNRLCVSHKPRSKPVRPPKRAAPTGPSNPPPRIQARPAKGKSVAPN
jgi:hypothetical protein